MYGATQANYILLKYSCHGNNGYIKNVYIDTKGENKTFSNDISALLIDIFLLPIVFCIWYPMHASKIIQAKFVKHEVEYWEWNECGIDLENRWQPKMAFARLCFLNYKTTEMDLLNYINLALYFGSTTRYVWFTVPYDMDVQDVAVR